MTRDEQLDLVRNSVVLGTWFGHCRWEYGGYESDNESDYYLYDYFVVRQAQVRENMILGGLAMPPRLPRSNRMPPNVRLRIDFFVNENEEKVCSRSFDVDLLDRLGLTLNKSYSIDRLLALSGSRVGKTRRSVRTSLSF